jgi:hypothetical protein
MLARRWIDLSRVTIHAMPRQGWAIMSMDTHAALGSEHRSIATQSQPKTSRWIEVALTALFAASAILFISFVAVVTGLV